MQKTIFAKGTVLYQNKLQQLDIEVEKGKITQIAPKLSVENAEVVDCTAKTILPALLDIHTHGAVGFDFNSANAQQMCQILDFFATQGVGYVLPTVMTDSDEVLCRQLSTIAQLAKTRQEIVGIHLEGPFLSAEYCGAMPKKFLQIPSVKTFEKFQKMADGQIKLVTLSPELDNAVDLTKYLTANGVVVSLGHSGADFDTTMRCVEAGAKSFTHTFNAMKQADKHSPNILGAAMLSDCFCEIITDGLHVNRHMVHLLAKIKGLDKVVTITDSMMASGMPDGQYTLAGNPVTVEAGDAKITGTNTRAGSTLTASRAVANFANFCQIDLVEALKTMTTNPAKLLGLEKEIGSIEVGREARLWIKSTNNE